MATNNPLLQGTVVTVKANEILDSTGQPLNGNVIYKEAQEVISNKKLSKIFEINKYNEKITGGTVVYTLGNRLYTHDLDDTGATVQVGSANQKTLLLDYMKSLVYEKPINDLILFETSTEESKTLSGDLIVGWYKEIAEAVERYKFCKNLALAVKGAKDRPADSTLITNVDTMAQDLGGLIPLVFPLNNSSFDQWRQAFANLATVINMTENMISDQYFGIDPKDFKILISPRVKTKLQLALANLGSELSALSLKQGEGDIMLFNGFETHVVPFLGTNVPVGQIDKKEAFDFTGVDIIMVHREALAFPCAEYMNTVAINFNSGNPRTIVKFKTNKDGGAILREKLVIGFSVSFGELNPDQATYNAERAELETYLADAANAIVAANGVALATPLDVAIKAYTGSKTVLDVANVANIITNPVNAATVSAATAFTFSATIPVVAGKKAIANPLSLARAYYKNA